MGASASPGQGEIIEMLNKEQQFDGDYTLAFYLTPFLWSKMNPVTGLPVKRDFGPWMATAMTELAHLCFLNGGSVRLWPYQRVALGTPPVQRLRVHDYGNSDRFEVGQSGGSDPPGPDA